MNIIYNQPPLSSYDRTFRETFVRVVVVVVVGGSIILKCVYIGFIVWLLTYIRIYTYIYSEIEIGISSTFIIIIIVVFSYK